MLVGSDGTETKATPEEVLDLWSEFDKLSDAEKNLIASNAIADGIWKMEEKFGIKKDHIGEITVLIRDLFFKKTTFDDCMGKLIGILEKSRDGSEKKASDIIKSIKDEIFTIQPERRLEDIEQEKMIAATREKLALLPALGKYAKLGEQQITRERIHVANQPEPVRPSLTNWLKCYREELGIGYHDPMLRAKFLFQSVNGKALSSDDRERVNLLLRSMEENAPLDIDTAKMEIVFPSFDVKEGAVPAAARPSPRQGEIPSAPSPQPRSGAAPLGQGSRGTTPLPVTSLSGNLPTDPMTANQARSAVVSNPEIPLRQSADRDDRNNGARDDGSSIVPKPMLASAVIASVAPQSVPIARPVVAPVAPPRPALVPVSVAQPVGTENDDHEELSRVHEKLRTLETEQETARREADEAAAANDRLTGQMEVLRRQMDEQAAAIRSLTSKPLVAPVAPRPVVDVPVQQKNPVLPIHESEFEHQEIPLRQSADRDDRNNGARDDRKEAMSTLPTPPMAPKRDPSVIPRADFTIRQTENAFGADRSSDALGSFSFDGGTAAEGSSGLRMAKGMQFTSLEKKELPKADSNTANLSFTSSHTLSVEKEGSGGFAIAQSVEKPLPMSRKYEPVRTAEPVTAPVQQKNPVVPGQSSENPGLPARNATPARNDSRSDSGRPINAGGPHPPELVRNDNSGTLLTPTPQSVGTDSFHRAGEPVRSQAAPISKPLPPKPKVNPFYITPRHNMSEEEQAVLAGIAGTENGGGRVVNLKEDA